MLDQVRKKVLKVTGLGKEGSVQSDGETEVSFVCPEWD